MWCLLPSTGVPSFNYIPLTTAFVLSLLLILGQIFGTVDALLECVWLFGGFCFVFFCCSEVSSLLKDFLCCSCSVLICVWMLGHYYLVTKLFDKRGCCRLAVSFKHHETDRICNVSNMFCDFDDHVKKQQLTAFGFFISMAWCLAQSDNLTLHRLNLLVRSPKMFIWCRICHCFTSAAQIFDFFLDQFQREEIEQVGTQEKCSVSCG